MALAEVKGISIPAREVGGDFFNYFVLPDGDLGLVVGDVSGKGVSAALLMANFQATLRARLPLERNLSQLADAMDREVDDSTPGGVFVTLPNSGIKSAVEQASRLCTYVRTTPVETDGQNLHVTISIGIAQYRIGHENWQNFLSRADAALYQAKHKGRDQWVVAEE